MNFLNLFKSSQAIDADKRDDKRAIMVTETLSFFRTVTAPNPDVKAVIKSADATVVGRASYGVSPLFDCVYLYDFEILPEEQGKSYGLQFLHYLSTLHQCPIIPVHETGSSNGFWVKARALLNAEQIKIAPSMSAYDLHQEHRRWPHLADEIERLNQEVSARIMVEEWDSAVGRGVDL